MSKMPIKKNIRNLLVAAFIGFADATNLLKEPIDFQHTYSIVLPSQKEEEKIFSLTSYKGRIDDITAQDLRGTGSLFEFYIPRIYPKNIKHIDVNYLTPDFSIYSGLFHVYGIKEQRFQETEPILFAGKKSVGTVRSIIEQMDDTASTEIVETIKDEISQIKELGSSNVQIICDSINEGFKDLTSALETQFSLLRDDISTLIEVLDKNTQRALSETPEHLTGSITSSIKKSIKESPKRLAESALDGAIKNSAKLVAKAIAAAFLS